MPPNDAFPDYAEGDQVDSRVTFSGTHQGNPFDLPPTRTEIAAGEMAFLLRPADGQAADQWIDADVIGLMQQPWALPAPGNAESRGLQTLQDSG